MSKHAAAALSMDTEPAAIVGTLTGVATAIVGVLVAFGLPLTDLQQGALLILVGTLAPVIAGLITRSKVFAPATVDEIATAVVEDGLGDSDAEQI